MKKIRDRLHLWRLRYGSAVHDLFWGLVGGLTGAAVGLLLAALWLRAG